MLEALQRASRIASEVLRWPAPRRDGTRGSTPGFDVYLEPAAAGGCEVVADDPDELEPLDRTSAFARVAPADACALRNCLAYAWARAGLYGLDAGANHALASSTAAYVAWVASPCEPPMLAAIDDYQASPHLAVSAPSVERGAVLFPWFLQSRYGLPHSLDLLHALWASSCQRTPPGHLRFVNKPDFFDVLRSFQKDRGAALGDLLLEYALARAFAGDRDNGMHLPGSAWLGAAGRVRFDARVDYAALPAWVRPAAPIEPTGAFYVWVDTKEAPKDAGLGFRLEWEHPAVFRVAVLKLGAAGQELARFTPASPEKDITLDLNIEDVSGGEALLIVGANAGASGGEFKFDPDELPYEPQSYLLTLVAQR
jgi:hypothetical protein